jgi:urease accessory protein
MHPASLELKSATARRMLMRPATLTTLIAAFVLAPAIALAHTGHADTTGLMYGLAHPITGIDHVLAMVAVGLLSVHLDGRALWLVPLSFIGVMVVGAALGMAGIQVPFAEVGIGLSVIVLGLAVACRFNLPTLAATALVGFFAVFHGYVHGAELPAAASGLPYAVGFVGATALLQGVGAGFGLLIGRSVVQAAGGAMAVLGIAVVSGLL